MTDSFKKACRLVEPSSIIVGPRTTQAGASAFRSTIPLNKVSSTTRRRLRQAQSRANMGNIWNPARDGYTAELWEDPLRLNFITPWLILAVTFCFTRLTAIAPSLYTRNQVLCGIRKIHACWFKITSCFMNVPCLLETVYKLMYTYITIANQFNRLHGRTTNFHEKSCGVKLGYTGLNYQTIQKAVLKNRKK